MAMSAKKIELESMSLDDLWSLHEQTSAILSTRIKAEKDQLEKRLAVLSGGMTSLRGSDHSQSLQDLSLIHI